MLRTRKEKARNEREEIKGERKGLEERKATRKEGA